MLEHSKLIIRYRKGQHIFRENDLVQGIYIIHSGKAKGLNTGFNGKVQIIRLARAGYFLGHRGFGDKYYQISVGALGDSVYVLLKQALFPNF